VRAGFDEKITRLQDDPLITIEKRLHPVFRLGASIGGKESFGAGALALLVPSRVF